ncbi:MAG: MerR family transcriptional regulator [Lachnospiraceae bacterium]|nr:MerR family transcriptional regulator [Lachnospiraceae bacterium]
MKEHSKSNEYSLRVSDFASLCNTTRDTLRYYYEKDLLVPWKNPKNGYHYYSSAQISSYFFISTMRQAGCSIQEIVDIVHGLGRKDIEALANQKIVEMQREAFLIQQKISSLKLGMWMLQKYDSHKPNVPFLDVIEPMSVCATPVSNPKEAYHTGDIAKDVSIHLKKTFAEDALPMFPSGGTIAYEDLVAGNYVYNRVITLSLLPADHVGTFPLPSCRAVLCYTHQNSSNIEKIYEKMLAYIKKSRLKACSDLYSISLINLYDKEKNHTYFKYLFLCVE